MIFRKIVERVHERHRVPAHCTPPEIRRVSSLRVCPTLLLGFVPAVIEKPSLRITRVCLHQNELLGYVFKVSVFVKGRGVLSVKWFAHVETIQPHLRRIDFLVPETAFGSSRLRLQLLA